MLSLVLLLSADYSSTFSPHFRLYNRYKEIKEEAITPEHYSPPRSTELCVTRMSCNAKTPTSHEYTEAENSSGVDTGRRAPWVAGESRGIVAAAVPASPSLPARAVVDAWLGCRRIKAWVEVISNAVCVTRRALKRNKAEVKIKTHSSRSPLSCHQGLPPSPRRGDQRRRRYP